MKLQIHVIPETTLDILTIILTLSFMLGTFVLYYEYQVNINEENQEITEIENFLEVILGNKCLLYEKTNSKGIFDYQKIKSQNFCLKNMDHSLNFYIENEKITIGKDCSNQNKVSSPAIFVKNGKFIEGYVEAC